jgi:DNA-directed RNA polymerase specialized sigma24 family protein
VAIGAQNGTPREGVRLGAWWERSGWGRVLFENWDVSVTLRSANAQMAVMENSEPEPEKLLPALLANASWVLVLAQQLLRDPHLADNVAQDVFTAAVERPSKFGLSDSSRSQRLRLWLGGITRHLATRSHSSNSERSFREARAAKSPIV